MRFDARATGLLNLLPVRLGVGASTMAGACGKNTHHFHVDTCSCSAIQRSTSVWV
jgi:hypothetical protein